MRSVTLNALFLYSPRSYKRARLQSPHPRVAREDDALTRASAEYRGSATERYGSAHRERGRAQPPLCKSAAIREQAESRFACCGEDAVCPDVRGVEETSEYYDSVVLTLAQLAADRRRPHTHHLRSVVHPATIHRQVCCLKPDSSFMHNWGQKAGLSDYPDRYFQATGRNGG